MARNTTLQEIVRMVREEAGHSVNAALGQNMVEAIKHKIRRQQDVLWEEHPWPHLEVERDLTLASGQQHYNFPADLSPSHRVEQVTVRHADEWRQVDYGITPAHYNSVDPMDNERRDPVLCWELYEGEQIEVWPLPDVGGDILRLRGTRRLRPLIGDSDRADLDDRMLSLFVAAELTAQQKHPNAAALLSQAQRLLDKLKGNAPRQRVFTRGSNCNIRVAPGRPRPLYGKRL